MIPQVLLIEDDDALRISLTQTLELEGMTVLQANGFSQARRSIRANFAGVVLSDIRMPGKDGFDILEHAQSVDTDLPVILLTGEADVPMALRAMRQGAYDFLEKPCATDHLIDVLNRALAYRSIVRQKRLLEQRLRKSDPAAVNFPGESAAVLELRSALRTISEQPVHVFVTGDVGVGKRLASHTIHALCAGDPLFEGVNFDVDWDDILSGLKISNSPTNLSVKNFDKARPKQVSMLEKMTRQNPDLRMIFSSNLPFKHLSSLHRDFLAALFVCEVEVPDLRQRKADLPVLFEALLRQTVRTLNIDMPVISDQIRAQLIARDWSGNLPELRNFARMVALGSDQKINGATDQSLSEQLESFEALVLAETLRRENGKATAAAQSLGLPRKTFYDRLARYDLRPKDFKQ